MGTPKKIQGAVLCLIKKNKTMQRQKTWTNKGKKVSLLKKHTQKSVNNVF